MREGNRERVERGSRLFIRGIKRSRKHNVFKGFERSRKRLKRIMVFFLESMEARYIDFPTVFQNEVKRIYGVQFHPEVTHTDEGKRLIRNFLYDICGCAGDWTMDAYAETAVNQLRGAVGDNGTVLPALSGGVDSSVAAALIYRAIGNRLTCVFVDHGLLRKGESGQGTSAAVIKSPHNVGGLPRELGFTELIEPLRMLFKDEVRALGLPKELVWRQPFPGPSLAIRMIGEVTPEKVRIVRESDAFFREEIAKAGLDRQVNQYFTVLTGVHSVGVMGDERS